MNAVCAVMMALAVGAVFWFAVPFLERGEGLARRDRWRCFADLPEFFELLGLGLSSGQSLNASWNAAVGHAPPGILRAELQRATHKLALGRPARLVMAELAFRLGDPRSSMALALVAQAMERGNPIEPVLLSQASSLRRLRLLEVERRAQTAPLRMMLPVLLLIFPAVLLLLMAPLVLKVAQGGSLF